MKKVILALALCLGFNASAGTGDIGSSDGPGFSAYVVGNILYATIMADTCNNYNAGLRVDGMCLKGRLIENYAEECSAKLEVVSTELYCGNLPLKPRVLKIDLNKSDVTSEAKVLHLEYNGNTIEVQLAQ